MAGQRQFTTRHDFHNNEEYTFLPNEYSIIEIEEFIHVPDGIVGHFVPGSTLIELGFSITAGKIDPGYGTVDGKRQQIRFGLKNLRSEANILTRKDIIVHIYFVDLRGLNNIPFEYTARDLKNFLQRSPRFNRDNDDGVVYDSE